MPIISIKYFSVGVISGRLLGNMGLIMHMRGQLRKSLTNIEGS
jgi:hypothetical protein